MVNVEGETLRVVGETVNVEGETVKGVGEATGPVALVARLASAVGHYAPRVPRPRRGVSAWGILMVLGIGRLVLDAVPDVGSLFRKIRDAPPPPPPPPSHLHETCRDPIAPAQHIFGPPPLEDAPAHRRQERLRIERGAGASVQGL